MDGIAIVSSKGGVGKSTLCHLLAIGSAWRGVPAYMFHTDNRDPMAVNNRPYQYIDGRNMERLSTIVGSLVSEEGLCIIDGGGNRPDFDAWIAQYMDLVLIPVTADTESVQQAQKTMLRLENGGAGHVRFLLNMVATNENERTYDAAQFYSKLDSSKVIGEIKRVSAVKRLGISDDSAPFPTPPSNVNNLARALHTIVSDALATEVRPIPELS